MGTKTTDYKREFNAKAYDRIELTVKKGEKEKIKEFAKKNGETLNGFLNRIIAENIN
jgi:hypothetical protein